MALCVVRDLKCRIDHFRSLDSVDPSFGEMLEDAYNSALQFSKRVFPRDRCRRPLGDIAVFKLEDALEYHLSNLKLGGLRETREEDMPYFAEKFHFPFGWDDPSSEEMLEDASVISQGIHSLEEEIHIFTQTVHKLEVEFADELYNSLPEGEEEGEDEHKSKMVGFSDLYNQLKQMLTDSWSTGIQIVSLVGMPGIGKTTLATEVFEDPDIVEHFDCRVWVRVGRKCGFNEILRGILVEVNPDHQLSVVKDEHIVECLKEILKGKKYFIVLDDIWDKYAAECLHNLGHRQFKRSLLLVISRLRQVNSRNELLRYSTMEMQLMDKEESWHLLREKVFAEEWCPSQLETFGRKIAEKCEGLPLTIVTVANLLSKVDKTAEYWNDVATQKKHQLFKDAYGEIMKVLLPSFKLLPRSLQMCFMYIGVFPSYYEILRSRLVNLWVADGFLELDQEILTDEAAILCLEELFINSVVMIKTTINGSSSLVGQKQIKTCRLHSSLWHLSNVLDSIDDGIGEDIKRQRRLSFHNNVLFAIKDVNKSVEESCASTARSLLCYGPYLPYQVPLCFGLRLLNKLDALTVRLYEFPMEVLQLVELRYLALTMNENLAPCYNIPAFKA